MGCFGIGRRFLGLLLLLLRSIFLLYVVKIVDLFDFLGFFLEKAEVLVSGSTIWISIPACPSLCVLFLEEIEETVGASNEVRMVRVDVCVLDFKEVHDHVSRGREALVEYLLHYVADPGFQFVVARQARKFDSNDNSSQLFVHLVGAV